MHANDNGFFNHEDRIRALDLLRRGAVTTNGRLALDYQAEPWLAQRLEHALHALEILGLAVVRRTPDGQPTGVTMSESGSAVAARLIGGGMVLFPATGGVRVVGHPDATRPEGSETSTAGPALILATAPSHYDADVVEGSETEVILDPLARWRDHPVFVESGRSVQGVRCAWEVFSLEGRSYGLILETAETFVGLDAHGTSRREDTLAGAAWQVRVNC